MRWPAKHTRPEINAGATRITSVFAWLPVYISGTMVWLEFYEILQVYNISDQKVIIEEKETTFVLRKWINLSKRLKS